MTSGKRKGCTRTAVTIGIIVVIGVLLLSFGGCIVKRYNTMVDMREEVGRKWGDVESVLQRRGDLIGNLVATVKRYAEHEEEVFIEVAKARASLNNATSPEEFSKASGELSNALSRLMVVVEAYPEIKANENFLKLQDQLEGTENRINRERMLYNEVVKGYNTFIKQFPQNIIANWFNFDPAEFFEAEEEAREAPDVEEMFDR
ncbi:LemA family protein [candidate division WOR-3 bacterium]|uniref:LemA family protein n=1 Tax=candidate division WOR-3 bacterium TaxID=2052148 RepID=A0A9D5QDE9_UNCW3|nr:LemA family protein [candidate division WOR-3 bacterium]MBD3365037.1 LemA family protein [candidate division WOR-3 bacterium]